MEEGERDLATAHTVEFDWPVFVLPKRLLAEIAGRWLGARARG